LTRRERGTATLDGRDVMMALGGVCTERAVGGAFQLTPLRSSDGTDRVIVRLRMTPTGKPLDPWMRWAGYVLEAEWSVNHALTLEGLMYRMVLEAYCASTADLERMEQATAL
jgi:hypothetical protein